jgi:dolichyl-phosphate beta-glucosyltransferase
LLQGVSIVDATVTVLPQKTPIQLSLIIPCFNEQQRLAESLPAAVATCRQQGWELLIVDDGSDDETAAVAKRLLEPLSDLGRVLKLDVHRGKGAAVRHGMRQARGDFIFFTDADLPYGLVPLAEGIDLMNVQGLDVVAGERQPYQAAVRSLPRSAASWLFRKLVGLIFNIPITDTQCGFKGLRAAAARELLPQMREEGFAFDLELFLLALKQGLRLGRLPVALINDKTSRVRLLTQGARMLGDLLGFKLEACGWLSGNEGDAPLAPACQTKPVMAAVLLLALAALIFGMVLLPEGFSVGDPANLEVASTRSFAEMLLTGEGLRAVSGCHFTPMMGMTLRIDWLLFGTHTFGYSLHSTLWLWLLGISALIFMRCLGAGSAAATVAALMVVSAPMSVSVAAWYSTRHYLAGLALSLLALSALKEYDRHGRGGYLVCAIFCYVMALLCKEVYFPLVLIAPFMVASQARRRQLTIIGFGTVAAVYLAVRQIVFSHMVAGYARGDYHPLDMLQSLAASWPRLTESVVWGGGHPFPVWPAVVLVNGIIVVCLIVAYLKSGPPGPVRYLAMLGASLLAVSFVLGDPHIRFAERLDAGGNDRLNLAFSTAVLLGLGHILFIPRKRPAGDGRTQPRRSGQVLTLAVGLVLLPVLWMGSLNSVQDWQARKYRAWQWRFIDHHLDRDWVLTGAHSQSLKTYIKLASRVRRQIPRLSARGFFETAEDWRHLDHQKVILMMPGKMPRRAADHQEMLTWLSTFNTRPSFAVYVRGRKKDAGPVGQ